MIIIINHQNFIQCDFKDLQSYYSIDTGGRKLNQDTQYDNEEVVSDTDGFLAIIDALEQNTTIIISENSNIEISDKLSILIDNISIIGEIGDDGKRPQFTFENTGHIDIMYVHVHYLN